MNERMNMIWLRSLGHWFASLPASRENNASRTRPKSLFQTLLRRWGQPMATILIGIQLLGLLSGCTSPVTKYRTEQVPVTVTKYRSERQTIEKNVEVPYTEEVKIPNYVQKSPSRVNPSLRTMKVAVLPFTTQSGNAADGRMISERIEGVLQGNRDGISRYALIQQYQILNATGKSDATMLRPSDTPAMRAELGLEALVTGHVRRIADEIADFRLEVFDLATQKALLRQAFSGPLTDSLKKVEDIFFGRRVITGYKTETVSKTRTERRLVTELVEVPYQATEYEQKQVSYVENEINILSSILAIGILVWVLSSSKED